MQLMKYLPGVQWLRMIFAFGAFLGMLVGALGGVGAGFCLARALAASKERNQNSLNLEKELLETVKPGSREYALGDEESNKNASPFIAPPDSLSEGRANRTLEGYQLGS